ncbi:GpE family phage tail protein [Magnetofaba australis]|nr:GpE family phage tail protein [Magnetofaba australis]
MADLALVFHWQPSELKALPLEELSKWRQMAIERFALLRP